MTPSSEPAAAEATGGARRQFHGLFGHRDFSVLWIASTQSQFGDQIGRVALSVLVFVSTGSAVATAATYALTYLPAVIGGVLLSGLADLLPRRGLLAACDVVRAVLFAIMALPAAPLWLVSVCLVLAVLVGSPYGAAAPAVVADMFTGDAYVAAQGLRTATAQIAQLVGFAAGGVIVAAIGARETLALNAATFAISAAVLQLGLTARPAAALGAGHNPIRQLRTGVRTVMADRRLRVLLGMSWLFAFWVIPEGVAAPYADAHGAGPSGIGLMLAASPAGSVAGVIVLTRWVSTPWRPRLLALLAPASGLPLLACLAQPPVWLAIVLLGVSGVCTSYLVIVIPEFVAIVPSAVRGQTIGIAASGLLAAQGIGLLLASALVSVWSAGTTIAVGGAIGVLAAVPLALAWRASLER